MYTNMVNHINQSHRWISVGSTTNDVTQHGLIHNNAQITEINITENNKHCFKKRLTLLPPFIKFCKQKVEESQMLSHILSGYQFDKTDWIVLFHL